MPKPEPSIEAMILGKLRNYAARKPQFDFRLSDLQEIAAECASVVPKPRPAEGEPRRSTRSMAVKAPVRPVAAPNPSSASAEPSAPLSARERAIQRRRTDPTDCAVLALVADGATNRLVAERLGLTIHQVKARVARWSESSQVSGRAALGTWARSSGILNDPAVTR